MKLPSSLASYARRTGIWAVALLLWAGCSKDDPQKEDTPELITEVALIFTPTGGGPSVTAFASDPDGEGVQDLVVGGPIELAADKQYVLTMELVNTLVAVDQPGYSITDEVVEEGQEHMFFFGWTGSVFQTPSGDGNIDNRSDEVDYVDIDAGGLPLGLISSWTSAATAGSGTFRVVLKHQPGTKTATSGSTVGETDLDLTFSINVQ
jgi:hypothetical protein